MTYRELRDKLGLLDDSQLDSQVKWAGTDSGVIEFYFDADELLVLSDHYVKAYGDGLQPLSEFRPPDEDPDDYEIFHIGKRPDLTVVFPAGTVLLTVKK